MRRSAPFVVSGVVRSLDIGSQLRGALNDGPSNGACGVCRLAWQIARERARFYLRWAQAKTSAQKRLSVAWWRFPPRNR